MIKKIMLFLVITLTFIFCFYNLGKRRLERWDEQTNAQVVQELGISPNPWILTLDKIPFFEKPPLWYWLTDISVKIFRLSDFSLRFVSGISGFYLIIIMLFFIGKHFSFKSGILSALLILSTGQLFQTGIGGFFSTHNFRSADPDSLQILFIFTTALCFYLTKIDNEKFLLGAVIFSALAVITKGPLGILPLIIWLTYHLLNHQTVCHSKKIIVASGIIFIILVLPWYVLMTSYFKFNFLQLHFGYHMIERVITPLENHTNGAVYYLKLLTNATVFPFLIPLCICLISVLLNHKLRQNYFFFSISGLIISIFIIALITQTKLSWYILGIYPFSAVLVGVIYPDIIKSLWKLNRFRYKLIAGILCTQILFSIALGLFGNWKFIF